MAGLASRAAVWSTAPESGIPGVSQYFLVGFGSGPKLGFAPWALHYALVKVIMQDGSFFSTMHLYTNN